MTKYALIRAYDTRSLELQVMSMLKNGWRLQGGVAIAVESRNCSMTGLMSEETTYMQAMVREEKRARRVAVSTSTAAAPKEKS